MLSELAQKPLHRAVLGVGGNLGDRYASIQNALSLLERGTETKILRTSYLYESDPMYFTEQPPFLNGAIQIETSLDPVSLLHKVKDIEKACGRETGKDVIRNGPRPIDLDILFYGNKNEAILNKECNPNLIIPHPQIQDRSFVIKPLFDLCKNALHPVLNRTISELYKELYAKNKTPFSNLDRIIPLPRSRFLRFDRSIVMGILNTTPDSFSDGGKHKELNVAVENALQMVREGADIVDIGGESTRPGAKEVVVDEELERTIPIITKIREISDVPISIDTRHSRVAHEAVIAGADIVNDVSGGMFDRDMFSTVADLGVPMVIMHMRGIPETMQSKTKYKDVLKEVSSSLMELSRKAESAGISRWLHILDPGIGFAKTWEQSLLLLANYASLRVSLNDSPILTGVSRKGFIGNITGEKTPNKRDYGTAGVCAAIARSGGTNIFRVHNVYGVKQAVMMADALAANQNHE